jgi:hypothetical protein
MAFTDLERHVVPFSVSSFFSNAGPETELALFSFLAALRGSRNYQEFAGSFRWEVR